MGVTLKELLDHLGLHESQLDQRCTDEHLRDIALHIDKWEVYASYLGLTQADIDGIKEDGRSNAEKKIRALQEWKRKNAFKATFRFLVEDVFLKAENAELAEKVCSLLIGKDSTDSTTSGNGQPNERPHSSAAVPSNLASRPPASPVQSQKDFKVDIQPKGQSTLPAWKPVNTNLNLLNISNAINTIVDWTKLGILLGLQAHKLATIRIDHTAYGQSRMKDEMITFWLAYDTTASWNKLCTALDNMDKRAVAAQIRNTLRKMES